MSRFAVPRHSGVPPAALSSATILAGEVSSGRGRQGLVGGPRPNPRRAGPRKTADTFLGLDLTLPPPGPNIGSHEPLLFRLVDPNRAPRRHPRLDPGANFNPEGGTMKIEETRDLWIIRPHAITGSEHSVVVCELEATARRIRKDDSSTAGEVAKVTAYRIGDDWYAPINILKPAPSDEREQAKADAIDAAVEEARTKGMAQDHINAILSAHPFYHKRYHYTN